MRSAAVLVTAALLFCPLAAAFADEAANADGAAPATAGAEAAPPLAASAPLSLPPPSFTGGFVSTNLYRGQRLGGPAFQPDVEIDGEGGAWGGGLWASAPLAGRVPGQSDPEVDAYGFRRFAVAQDFALIPGAELYAYPGGGDGPPAAAPAGSPAALYRQVRPEPNLTAEIRCGPVTLLPELFYDLRLRGPTAACAAEAALPLTRLGTEIDLKVEGGAFDYDRVPVPASSASSASDARLSGGYADALVTIPYRVSAHATVTAGWSYADGLDQRLHPGGSAPSRNPLQTSRGAATLSVAWSY